MAELEAIAARSGPPLLLVLLSCARPLLAAEEDADSLFQAALGQDRSAPLSDLSQARDHLADAAARRAARHRQLINQSRDSRQRRMSRSRSGCLHIRDEGVGT